MRTSRFFSLVTGLFYPAFLGAWIYEALEKIGVFNLSQFFIISSLLSHYVMDYAYLVEEHDKEYGWSQLFIDVSILVCVYLSLKVSLSSYLGNDVYLIWSLMASVKLLAVVWEILHQNKIGIAMDFAFLILYLIGVYCFSDQVVLLGIICVIDCFFYYFYFRLTDMQRNS